MFPFVQTLVVAAFTCTLPATAPTASSVLLAAELGLTPESLVVAGFTTNEAAAMVDTLGATSEAALAMANAYAVAATKATALATAEETLRAAPNNPELVTARNTVRSELAQANAALAALRGTLRAALVEAAGSEKKALFAAYVGAAGRAVPAEFKAVSRTDAEWAALESALRAEARATRRQEALDQAAASLLTTARANETVSAAATRLSQGLPAMQTALTPAY